MIRVLFLTGSLLCVAACGAPLRQVPLTLDPASPDAPESAPLPPRRAPADLPPPAPPAPLPTLEPSAPNPPPPMEDMPAGHHMHHMHHMPDMTPKPSGAAPQASPPKPMEHHQHGGAGEGR